MRVFKKAIIRNEKVVRCEKCGGKKVGPTLNCYTRGWNDLCNQADGDYGAYCEKCGHITFVKSLEEYKKTIPAWCRAFNYKK
jgi:DNA-directed RNA polymerase subunit RPC12/RpoP